ncbi:MAG: phosphatidylglycerophosphatase A [Proteobacteria bacterium]|nr:phosphatidylglycerophosphatase A [Pseudomonadota bacterium]
MDRFLYRLATLFGVGKLPRAPGTWGSLAALIIAVPLLHYITWPIFIGLTAVLFMLDDAVAGFMAAVILYLVGTYL